MSAVASERGTLPAALGRFASSIDARALPPEVVDKAKRNLLHDLSCALAGWPFREEIWPVARLGGSGHSTVIGEGSRAPADVAAFANGALMHARSQDDTHLPARCHAGAAVIPAALAVTEREGGDGADLLAAVVAGYEVAIALGLAASEGMTKRGFRASGVLAPMAAAAAAARAMKLGSQQAADAIAIACSFAAGLSQTWLDGTTEYRWELALGARNGVLAADLAASGNGGAPGAFEGAAGLGVAFAGSARVFDELEIGEEWRILEVIYKPQPVCNLLQTHVELAASVAADAGIDPGEVDSVKCWMNEAEREYPGTLGRPPFVGIGAALMSGSFCLALALRDRGASVDGLRELDDPGLRDLSERVEILADPQLPPLSCRLEVRLKDGRTIDAEALPGPDVYDWDWDRLGRNIGLMEPEMGPLAGGVPALVEAVRGVDSLPSVAPLVEATLQPVAHSAGEGR